MKSLFIVLSSFTALFSLQAFSNDCYEGYCVGDRIYNVSPKYASEVKGTLISKRGLRDFTVRWESGREEDLIESVWHHGLEAKAASCGITNGTKVCVGDRVVVHGDEFNPTLYYVDIIAVVEDGMYVGPGEFDLYGQLVGDPEKRAIRGTRVLAMGGRVPGFDLVMGKEISNNHGSKDIVLGHANNKYFVYMGEKGQALPISKKGLAERLNITLPVLERDHLRGKKCPDYSGTYISKGCTSSKDEDFWWPYSSSNILQSDEVMVEQTGCEELEISYDQRLSRQPPISSFSSEGNALSAKYDLTKAKFSKNTMRIHYGKTEGGASLGGECLPFPIAMVQNKTQDYTVSMDKNVLKTTAKFVEQGFFYVVPFRHVTSVKCEMVRK